MTRESVKIQVHQDLLQPLNLQLIAVRWYQTARMCEISTQSLDNTEKLAKESLQIGSLLGLKIIHNEKAAEARITRSLRSNSKKLQ